MISQCSYFEWEWVQQVTTLSSNLDVAVWLEFFLGPELSGSDMISSTIFEYIDIQLSLGGDCLNNPFVFLSKSI